MFVLYDFFSIQLLWKKKKLYTEKNQEKAMQKDIELAYGPIP